MTDYDIVDIEDPLDLFEWYKTDTEETMDAIGNLCIMARKLQSSSKYKKHEKYAMFLSKLDKYMIEVNDLLNVLWTELDDIVGQEKYYGRHQTEFLGIDWKDTAFAA